MDDIEEMRRRLKRLEIRLEVHRLDRVILHDRLVDLLQECRPRHLGVGVLISNNAWQKVEDHLKACLRSER